MNSVFLSGIIVLCIVSTTLAALALGPAQVHPSQPNNCYQESSKKFYKPGEAWTEEGCMEASCVMVNYTGIPRLMISYASCGVVGVDPPCYLTENKAAAYPDCCPEPVCPDSSEETTAEQLPPQQQQQQHHQQQQQQQQHMNMKQMHKDEKDLYDNRDLENELPKDLPYFNEIIKSNPWDDDYLYDDQDHMNNNVDDWSYVDYFPSHNNERRASPRFTRRDFAIDNYRWF